MHSWGSSYIEIIKLMNLEMGLIEMIIFTSYTKANNYALLF